MIDATKDRTKALIELLGIPAEITVDQTDEGVSIGLEVDEDHAGIIIGSRGEGIDALQLILNLMVNQDQDDWQRVVVNINDYRERRQETVEAIADKAAHNAKTTGKEVILTHLPSHERRLVHMYLQDDPEIDTYSEGVGRHRHLVVAPVNPPST